jgi:hypothetical protein
MNFTKHLTSVLIFLTYLFCTNSAFSQSNGVIITPPLEPQVVCTKFNNRKIYMDVDESPFVNKENYIQLYYENYKNQPPYPIYKIKSITVNNPKLQRVNQNSKPKYLSVNVTYQGVKYQGSGMYNGRNKAQQTTLNKIYLEAVDRLGRIYTVTSDIPMQKSFRLTDCQTIEFQGLSDSN